MIGCLVFAFYLCNPNYAPQAYAVAPPQVAYAQAYQPNVYAVPQPYVVAQPVYPVYPVQPVVRLNFGGYSGWHRGRW
jgi:hypothetical protein